MSDAVNRAGFAFVQGLASDLNTGTVKIPSFPDIVVRIKKALDNPNCDIEKLTRVAGSEPALAARLLSIANSALMQRGGNGVNDLRTAISRVGSETLRTAAMTVALEQIFIGSSLGNQRKRLRAVWKEAAHVAAISFSLARNLQQFNPDEALMAGLLHNVGKLYILMRATDFEEFFDSEDVLDTVIEQWHGQVGQAILEGWGFSEEMAAAASGHMDLARAVMGPPDLTDLVTVAWLMSQPAANDDDADVPPVRAYSRIGLDDEKRASILAESQADIESLQSALAG